MQLQIHLFYISVSYATGTFLWFLVVKKTTLPHLTYPPAFLPFLVLSLSVFIDCKRHRFPYFSPVCSQPRDFAPPQTHFQDLWGVFLFFPLSPVMFSPRSRIEALPGTTFPAPSSPTPSPVSADVSVNASHVARAARAEFVRGHIATDEIQREARALKSPFHLKDLLTNQFFLALWSGIAAVALALLVNSPLTQAAPPSSLCIAKQDNFKLFMLFLFFFVLVAFAPLLARLTRRIMLLSSS